MTAGARHGEPVVVQDDLTEVYGARFFAPGSHAVVEARPTNLYHYRAFIGVHDVAVEAGDCVYSLGDDARAAALRRGPARISSRRLAVVVRGYMPEDRTTTIQQGTTLPYVNGCSTKQIGRAS